MNDSDPSKPGSRWYRFSGQMLVGKSPAELLNGSPHPHWLEMLAYVRFSRN